MVLGALCTGLTAKPLLATEASPVKLSEVVWKGVGAYKIDMPMGTVYFEKDGGVSGFKSFLDNEGNDWIASYLPPGPNGNFRGFPNSVGNFGHAGRDSGSATTVVGGKTEGDRVILESTNGTFTFRYHFFADHIAVEVLKSEGDYNFLFEGVIGGTADAEDYFVTADGKRHIPSGEFWDFTPEWFYLGDPKAENLLFLAKTPDDDAPNENHRQIRPNGQHNMDLYSFGRTGREHGYAVQGMSGNEHVVIIGFVPKSRTHGEIAAMLEGFLADPFTPSTLPVPTWSAALPVPTWSAALLEQDADWYASPAAVATADSVLKYQSPEGGWPKNTDLAHMPEDESDIPGPSDGRINTIDNNATTEPMRYLAQVITASGEERFKTSFMKGLAYLLAAQYPNGGWPQFWPLRGDAYYSRATFNDDAMINVLMLLRAVAEGDGPYGFVPENNRMKAQRAVELGTEFILKTQIKQQGKLTAWAAQYDENTLEPAWARAYEPPSLSGNESVGIVRFLMGVKDPSPQIIEAVESAVAWFRASALEGVRHEVRQNPDGRRERLLLAAENAPPLWARFYELDTNRPLYLDRDSVYHYTYDKVGYERRSGYNYHGYWAADLVEKEYPQWRRDVGRPSHGMSESGKQKLRDYLSSLAEAGQIAGGVLQVTKDGQPLMHHAFGWQDREAQTPMDSGSLFRIASQTKAITTTAAMMLVDQGKLGLDDPIATYIPEFGDPSVQSGASTETVRPITIRDLMSHTSGIPYRAPKGSELDERYQSWYLMDLSEDICTLAEQMAAIPLQSAPGERFVYGYNTDILGCIVERVSGVSLDRFFADNIFTPLGMKDTFFYVPESHLDRLAAVYSRTYEGLKRSPNPGGHVEGSLVGQGRFTEKDRKVLSGGAGLVSTSADYTRFLTMLLNGGEFGGQRLLSENAVREMTETNQLRGAAFVNRPGKSFGLGFYILDDVETFGEPASEGTYGWGGAFHSTYWVDPVENLTVVYLTQVRPATGLKDNAAVRALIYGALEY